MSLFNSGSKISFVPETVARQDLHDDERARDEHFRDERTIEEPGHGERTINELATNVGVQTPGLAAEGQVIPLIEEQLVVSKRTVETGTVRLHKHTEERVEEVRVPLTEVRWQVEHVPVGRVVESAPGIRQEGDTTVYPVIEERLVVRREIVLVEEVRVTRGTATTQHESTYTLKREQITEDRGDAEMRGVNASSAAMDASGAGTPGMYAHADVEAAIPSFVDMGTRRQR